MIVAPALMTAAPPAPPQARKAAIKADFSAVTSLAAAEALARQGKLVRVLLFPAEFGGDDVSENAVCITPEAAEARAAILGTLRRLVTERERVIDKLDVTPDYKGRSFVPGRIVMHATRRKTKGSFEPTVEVWQDCLDATPEGGSFARLHAQNDPIGPGVRPRHPPHPARRRCAARAPPVRSRPHGSAR